MELHLPSVLELSRVRHSVALAISDVATVLRVPGTVEVSVFPYASWQFDDAALRLWVNKRRVRFDSHLQVTIFKYLTGRYPDLDARPSDYPALSAAVSSNVHSADYIAMLCHEAVKLQAVFFSPRRRTQF